MYLIKICKYYRHKSTPDFINGTYVYYRIGQFKCNITPESINTTDSIKYILLSIDNISYTRVISLNKIQYKLYIIQGKYY